MTVPVPGWLRRHPFAVEAFFERSVVLAYAFPVAAVRDLLPAPLEIDAYRGEHALVAVAAVQTRALRPRGLPALLGTDFLLMGYRVFARFRSRTGRRLRGLYILRSETDRASMAVFGNLLTRYHYVKTGVRLRDDGSRTEVGDPGCGLTITVDRGADGEADLPPGSPFADLKDARRYAGPLPFTFSVEPGSRRVVIIEGVRSNWSPRPVRVLEHRVPFLESLADEPPVLANAFTVEKVPYCWKKGVVETWTP